MELLPIKKVILNSPVLDACKEMLELQGIAVIN
jgi:hypothetical protein